jgi:hypothetical protein
MAASRKIHRCFERVNQLLSLLVPVSDINRAAAGRVAAHRAVASFVGIHPKYTQIPKRANGEV